MKKIFLIFVIFSIFMVQLTVVRADDNINLEKEVYNNIETDVISCGNNMIEGMPVSVPRVINIVYLVIQISVPVILVVMGMITLMKSITSSKEDEIKKAQLAFVKKLITGAIVFFVFVIMKVIVSVAADTNKSPDIIDCANCFLNGTKNCNTKVNESKNSK